MNVVERDTYDKVSNKLDHLPFPTSEAERIQYRQNRLDILEQAGWTQAEWEEENERRTAVAVRRWFEDFWKEEVTDETQGV